MNRGLACTPVNTYGRISPPGVFGGLALTCGVSVSKQRLVMLHAVGKTKPPAEARGFHIESSFRTASAMG
jgi:hypothetical protein